MKHHTGQKSVPLCMLSGASGAIAVDSELVSQVPGPSVKINACGAGWPEMQIHELPVDSGLP